MPTTLASAPEAALFEIVTEAIQQVPFPEWVFREFDLPPEDRGFDYAKMLFADGTIVNHSGQSWSVSDISQPMMWFFFLAASYMNIGIEAIYFGQLDLLGRNDPEYRNWADLLAHLRSHAAKHVPRHYLICSAHVPKAGPVVDGKLLLKFRSFPLPSQRGHRLARGWP